MYFVAVLISALCLIGGSLGFQQRTFRPMNLGLKQSHLFPSQLDGYASPSLLQRSDFALSQSSSDDSAKSGGIEPKYLAALGVFLFAALYDFFITHGGQPYLAHPPTL
jgi:hypothetical protein